MVCSAQTVLLSCVKTSTIFKWTETRIYLTHVTLVYHRVHLMGQGVVPDLLVSVDKLDLGWIRRWLSDYNDHKVAAP